MSTPNEPVIVPTEPVEVPAPVEAPKPQLRYEYQPTDEQGRPLGGRQVILYATPDELATKLTDQNTQLIRKLREVTREHRLGIKPNENIPADAERFDNITEFKPRNLTEEERFTISQDINDPEKFLDARNKIVESAFGAPLDQVTRVMNEQQMYIAQLKANENYSYFVEAVKTQGYLDVRDNRKTIVDWMLKNKLAPTVTNFNYAYSSLKESGLILEAPVVQQEPTPIVPPVPDPAPVATVEPESNPQTPAASEPRIGNEAPPQAKRQSHVPSGLNNNNSSASGASPSEPAIDGLSLTLEQIDRIPGDKLKGLMRDPKFREHYERLLTPKK